MILQGIQESEHPVLSVEKNGVILTITGTDCAYAWSEPNGYTNYAIPENYHSKYERKAGVQGTSVVN
jgi:hypothetical protein